MSTCVIFGGSGFIGTHLARHFLHTGRFEHVHLADIRPSELEGSSGISYSQTDVRRPLPLSLVSEQPDWIFNLAAIHREPGHEHDEYFATNLPGARNVCAYAESVRCRNIYFTSSISVYGPTLGPTSESSPIRPTTPYGGSKYPSELIHEAWQRAGEGRRLLISRPGVVYGPGDPGNIMRMIKAIKRGYFAFPGSPEICKSYAYVFGLIDSIDFLMDRSDPLVTYNYVESPTEPLKDIVRTIKTFLNCKAVTVPIPLWMLLPLAHLIQKIKGNNTPIHPVRVRKAAMPTHIVPQTLIDLGFEFKYDFLTSLKHWLTATPEDFRFAGDDPPSPDTLQLDRGAEEPPAGLPEQSPQVVKSESGERE